MPRSTYCMALKLLGSPSPLGNRRSLEHPNDFAKTWTATVGGIGSGRSLGAASKCEHWRSIDLADLKRMGLLKPIVDGRIRAITWKNDHGGQVGHHPEPWRHPVRQTRRQGQ